MMVDIRLIFLLFSQWQIMKTTRACQVSTLELIVSTLLTFNVNIKLSVWKMYIF